MSSQAKPLSQVLPPLILGTATFNSQYNSDPTRMPYVDIVRRALEHDIAAFDTSPYYGPSEMLLGDALRALTPPPTRDNYFLITKAGRIANDEFDYSPSWIRYSVCRSLERLDTPYLDLVYTHDVEFVSAAEVLGAVQELRRMRDRGLIRYVGISGYPVEVLVSLAEMVLDQTGEPLDAVMSYSNFCVQNSRLGREDVLRRFEKAGVACVLNASMLGMGLITTRGADNAPMASWHPAPPELRELCRGLSSIAAQAGEHLEEVAIRWALDNWARVGSRVGSTAGAARGADAREPRRIGVSVMGVSNVDELEQTWNLWESVMGPAAKPGQRELDRRNKIESIVRNQMWPRLGTWRDFTWESGGQDFVNRRQIKGVVPVDEVSRRWGLVPNEGMAHAKI